MKPYGNQDGQKRGHPDVPQKAPGPMTKVITHNLAAKVAPNSGNTKRGMQSGYTDERTDGGGGKGNNSHYNHKSFIGR